MMHNTLPASHVPKVPAQTQLLTAASPLVLVDAFDCPGIEVAYDHMDVVSHSKIQQRPFKEAQKQVDITVSGEHR